MSPDPISAEFYKGPAYALVVGISKYEHGSSLPQIKDEEFPNLCCAAKDATDVAEFLKNNGFIEYNVTPLIDEQATLAAIKDAFETLKKQCKRSGSENPLVIVYFAGHGIAADDEDDDRHYLVPYDARRDKLVSTALENDEFRRLLEAVKTTRLVVFLDACHGGAFARAGSRGVSGQFAPAGLGEGSGRYIIASCGPNQESWEWKDPARKNGIFTWHLLELLKCEHQEFTEEEIDIFTLFPKLRDRVKQSAFREHAKEQEPIGELKAATGIVLAINRHAQQERRDREQGTAEKRQRLLEAVVNGIRNIKCNQPVAVITELRKYVLGDQKREGVEFIDFYGLFDEYVAPWDPDLDPQPMPLCRNLVFVYDAASKPGARPLESKPPATLKVSDKFVEVSEKSPAPSEIRAAAAPSTPADKAKPRRQLTADDRDYLLVDIRTEIDYVNEAKALDDALRRPISEAEFAQTWHRIRNGKEDDARLDALMGDIMTRFRERWPRAAQALENASVFTYRAQK